MKKYIYSILLVLAASVCFLGCTHNLDGNVITYVGNNGESYDAWHFNSLDDFKNNLPSLYKECTGSVRIGNFNKEYEEFENNLKNATYKGSSYTPNSTNQTGGVIVRSGTISHTTGSYGGSMYTVYTGYKTKGLWVYVWDEGKGKYSDEVDFDFGERE